MTQGEVIMDQVRSRNLTLLLVFGILSFLVFLKSGQAQEPAKPAEEPAKQVAVGISKEEYVQRHKEWAKSSEASIARGKESYQINCAFCHQTGSSDLLAQVKSGKLTYGGRELDLFRILSMGLPQKGMGRMDHLLENERWDIVHYLRSLNPGLPSSSASDMNQYYQEGTTNFTLPN